MTCWISVPNKLELDSLLAVIRPYPFCNNNNNKWWATETWRCDDQDSTQNISMQIYSHIANCRRSSQHHRTAEEVQLLVIVCLLLTLQNSYVTALSVHASFFTILLYFTDEETDDLTAPGCCTYSYSTKPVSSARRHNLKMRHRNCS